MHPVTGPHRTETGSIYGAEYSLKVGYRQKKPYNIMLAPFSDDRISYSSTLCQRNAGVTRNWMLANMFDSNLDNSVYARFIGKMRQQTADLGVTLGEYSSAREMLTKRAKQLFDLASALRRRDFRKARRIIGPNKHPTKNEWMVPDFPSLWLEWSWGWRPMIEDVGNALETLVSPVLPQYVRVSATKKVDDLIVLTPSITDIAPSGTPSEWRKITRGAETWSYDYTVAVGASVIVSNPNVALANRLGLINIPGIIWAVQPFSFVVDKYVNIGQMIGSLTDTFGFTLNGAWNSRKWVAQTRQTYLEERAPALPPGVPAPSYVFYKTVINGNHTTRNRLPGILGPVFSLRNPSIGSLGEAASYFSLLCQLLRSSK